MEINKKLIDAIDIFVEKCENFDIVYKEVVTIINKEEDNIDKFYDLVQNYIEIRSVHGRILKNYENYSANLSEDSDEDMYNLSSLNSIIENSKNLIQNIDFQYKQFAVYYPDLIENSMMSIILLVNTEKTEKDKMLINAMNEIKNKKYKNKYEVVECNKKDKIELKISKSNKKVMLSTKKLPCLYLLNNKLITKIDGENIANKDSFESLIG